MVALALLAAVGDMRLATAAVFFAVAGAIAETFHVSLPSNRPGNVYNMTVGAAVWIAAVLLFPPQWAILIVAAGFAVGRRAVWQSGSTT